VLLFIAIGIARTLVKKQHDKAQYLKVIAPYAYKPSGEIRYVFLPYCTLIIVFQGAGVCLPEGHKPRTSQITASSYENVIGFSFYIVTPDLTGIIHRHKQSTIRAEQQGLGEGSRFSHLIKRDGDAGHNRYLDHQQDC
jgi:hypothetical protein